MITVAGGLLELVNVDLVMNIEPSRRRTMGDVFAGTSREGAIDGCHLDAGKPA